MVTAAAGTAQLRIVDVSADVVGADGNLHVIIVVGFRRAVIGVYVNLNPVANPKITVITTNFCIFIFLS